MLFAQKKETEYEKNAEKNLLSSHPKTCFYLLLLMTVDARWATKIPMPTVNVYIQTDRARSVKSNIVVEWLTFLLRNLQVPVSNLGLETDYPD
jgi:hypothetical protein